jgi:hypothetical protein
MNTLTWNKKASGIWSAIVGKDESLKPLSVVGANPVKDA